MVVPNLQNRESMAAEVVELQGAGVDQARLKVLQQPVDQGDLIIHKKMKSKENDLLQLFLTVKYVIVLLTVTRRVGFRIIHPFMGTCPRSLNALG